MRFEYLDLPCSDIERVARTHDSCNRGVDAGLWKAFSATTR